VTLAVRSRKRATFDTLRLVVTITTFALILWWVGIAELATAFTNVVWFWVVMRLAPFTASMWVQAVRWNLFLHLEGIETDNTRLFRRIWMSRFFAHTLPGSMGGDIFRVIESSDYSDSKLAVARSVLLDRVVGLVSLALYISIACLMWAWQNEQAALTWISMSGALASILALLLLTMPLPRRIAVWIAAHVRVRGVSVFFSELAQSLAELAGRPGLIVRAAAATVLFNVTWAIGTYLGFLALEVSISPLLVIALMPIVYGVSALPVSINGLGVSEGLFVVVFVASGIEPADAAAVSILLRVTGIGLSCLGGLLYLWERKRLARAPVT
jgi:uncharacterized protein (TIRG00374 family)